jgi:hypothetical protein
MTEPSYKPEPGDVFLLFQEIPYDFDDRGEPPIKILENLYFDWTPQKLLDSKRFSSDRPDDLRNSALVNMVRSGPRRHYCLRYENGKINQNPDKIAELFSIFITALRLQKPCLIEVAGRFTFGGDDEPMQDTDLLLCLTSVHNLTDGSYYSQNDLQHSSDITKDLLEILQSGDENWIKSALTYFSQVTQGFSQYSLQLSYLGLWAALEALFQHEDEKIGKTLAKRITAYLFSGFGFPHFDSPQDMEEWLKNEYKHRRNRFAHGSHIATPTLQNITKAPDAFSKLHEITRLCLLGFLTFDKSERTQILQQTGKQLQHTLDNLGQARGKYLDQQQMYLREGKDIK